MCRCAIRCPTLILGRSETSAASSLGRRAVVANALVAALLLMFVRSAARIERVADCLSAMGCVDCSIDTETTCRWWPSERSSLISIINSVLLYANRSQYYRAASWRSSCQDLFNHYLSCSFITSRNIHLHLTAGVVFAL